MVKDIVKDIEKLSQKSVKVNLKEDRQIITDLLDTAKYHTEDCVGLAAIQIGCKSNVFVVKNFKSGKFNAYVNPYIVKRSTETYETEEGCLSLDDKKKVKRNNWIDIIYTNLDGKLVKEHVEGYKAEIIQHEYDHLFGKLI